MEGRTRIEELEAENASLQGMLAYERNKFARQMKEKEAGIAEQLSEAIALEVQAIRELCGYVEEDDRRRILRRLRRIDDILQNFSNE